MKTKKKDLPEENTQLLSSDQNQTESNPNPRSFIRDAAMAAAGVAAGVGGSSFVHAQSSDEAENATAQNVIGTPVNDASHPTNETTSNSITPSVNSPATDAANENVKPDASSAPEEVVLTTANGANVAHVDNTLTFAEAFEDARTQVGPGGVFSYNGQLYNTYYRQEWENLTTEQKNEYYASISEHSAPHDDYIHPQSAPEPTHEASYSTADSGAHSSGNEVYVLGVGSATIEGHEVYLAHLSTHGEDVILLDIDRDGTFDLAVADVNSDGTITKDEVIDISQHHLTVDQMQEASHPEPNVFVQDPNTPDYTNDADISHFV